MPVRSCHNAYFYFYLFYFSYIKPDNLSITFMMIEEFYPYSFLFPDHPLTTVHIQIYTLSPIFWNFIFIRAFIKSVTSLTPISHDASSISVVTSSRYTCSFVGFPFVKGPFLPSKSYSGPRIKEQFCYPKSSLID